MMSSVNHDDFAHLKIPLEDVLSATNNFDEENLLVEDDFGDAYTGEFLWSGDLIEIDARRFNKEWDEREQEFWREISMLSSLKHKNVVSLVGFCDENDEKIIITKLETRASLGQYLSDPMLLTWVRRLQISVGVAHALSYIHYDESRDFSVIHRNIDSGSIYLNDDWEPKLGDFTCSIKIKASERHNSFNNDIVWSTDGYTDPTYIETNVANHKSDMYSFGIVMFELLCGREAVIEDDQDNKYLASVAVTHYRKKKLDEIIDWDQWNQIDSQSFDIFAETAYDCLNEERSQRPNIDEIVTRLEKALELQLEHQNETIKGLEHVKQTIKGLELVRDEIQVALKIVCESHNIGVAQVWISYEDENHVPFSFSSEDTQTTRMLVLKLTGYNSVNEDSTACHWRFKEYYDACNMVPLKKGDELVEKTLQDYQPRFCKNISQLGTDTLMAWLSTDDVACSCFTICMSIDTGDFNCAFEFIWHHNPNYAFLLEALLLTLKRHLPRFKFASGAKLGEQLHVIDVEKSTETKTKFFKIFKGKRLSAIPEAMNKGKKAMLVNYNALPKEKRDTTQIELSRENIEQHYGKTMKKAAEELGVSLSTLKRKHNKLGMSGWQGPYLPQRKAYNSNKNQSNKSHTHEKDNGAIQDPSPAKRNENIVIKAEYADDIIKLRLGISDATFITIENEIGKKFKLKHGTFKIKYLDEDEEWILMTSDQDMSDCVQNSRNVVRLQVLLHNQ